MKMSWFKKIFRSQYGFNSQSSSQGSPQGSSQEPKVHYVKDKTETDGNDTEIKNLTIRETEECDDATQSTRGSCYSWSGVSQEIDIKGEKREFSDNEEKPWWESFKSQSTQKSTQETQLQEYKSSRAKAEASSSQDDNRSDDEDEKKEDEKISFYLKLGKYKTFKHM